MTTSPGPFDYERHTLRWILQSLMGPKGDFDRLCIIAPRIANSVAALSRAETAALAHKPSPGSKAVQQALQELIEERAEEEET